MFTGSAADWQPSDGARGQTPAREPAVLSRARPLLRGIEGRRLIGRKAHHKSRVHLLKHPTDETCVYLKKETPLEC